MEIRKIRSDSGDYDLYIPDNLPEVFADGVVQTLFGSPVSKILFYSVSSAASKKQRSENVEIRRAVQQLTIPLASMLDFAHATLTTAYGNSEALEHAFDSYREQVSEILSRPRPEVDFIGGQDGPDDES